MRGQGLQSRPIELLKQTGAALVFPLPKRAIVQMNEQFPNGFVNLRGREEASAAQPHHDPALDHLNGAFDFSFVEKRALQIVAMV